jgi:putative nucleotidyltransferase-like protein
MALTLLDTFRILSSFTPQARGMAEAPWDAYVEWAIAQGVAPLAAYNLEYRLAGAGAPEWARDRLLSVYQGSLNDNVMRLVNFKRAVDELEGARVLLLGAASFAESLYPHVAFRPVPDIQLWAQSADLPRLVEFLRQSDFRSDSRVDRVRGAAEILSDRRTEIAIFTHFVGERVQAHEKGVFERALPVKVYGPSIFRPSHEDAILLLCLDQAKAGYEVPMISFVDLRELLHSKPVDFERLKQRASEWRIDRALYTSASIVQRLFPEVEAAAQSAKPTLRASTQRLLEKWVIAKVVQLGPMRILRGTDRWRRLLAGG